MRLPVAEAGFPLPAIREHLYDIVEIDAQRNTAVVSDRVIRFIVSHPHCKSSHIVHPLSITNKGLFSNTLNDVIGEKGFLLTIRVFFRLDDKHISEHSEALLRAYFGNSTCLSSQTVKEHAGRSSYFTLYVYGALSRHVTLHDMLQSLCMAYYWRMDDIKVGFETSNMKYIPVSTDSSAIPLHSSTCKLGEYFKKNNIIYMVVQAPSIAK